MNIDRVAASKFLSAIAGGSDESGFQLLGVRHADKQLGVCEQRYAIESTWNECDKLTADGHGLYAMVNFGDAQNDASVTRIRALFVDCDDGALDIDAMTLRPHIVVHSGHGDHAYWLVDDCPVSEFKRWQLALATRFATDTQVVNPSRMMRIPGTWHQKDAEPRLVTADYLVDVPPRYTLAQMITAFDLEAASPAIASVSYSGTAADEGSLSLRQYRAAQVLRAKGPAVEGSGGDLHTFKACTVGGDFDLTVAQFWPALLEWNATCVPMWGDLELRVKLEASYRNRKHPLGRALSNDGLEPGQILRIGGAPPLLVAGTDYMEVGDDVETGQWLRRLLPELLIADRNHVWSYDAPTWRVKPIKLLKRSTAALSQTPVFSGHDKNGEIKTRPLKLTKSAIAGAIDCMESELDGDGFFDERPKGVGLSDGFLNVSAEGVELQPHSSDHRLRAITPIDWSEASASEKGAWDSFLRSLFGADYDGNQKIDLLAEFIGLSLIGEATRFQSAVVLEGQGANGKSMFIDGIRSLFPPELISLVPWKSFEKSEKLCDLVNARLNICDEVSLNTSGSNENLKRLVAGRPVETRMLYKQAENVQPEPGLLFALNEFPYTGDQTDGFWRRFMVVKFNRSFMGDSDVRDPVELEEELRNARAEILQWAIKGAVRALKNKAYTKLPSSEQAKELHRNEGSVVAFFVSEDCEKTTSPQEGTTFKHLYATFRDLNPSSTMAKNKFSSSLRSMGIEIKRVGNKNVPMVSLEIARVTSKDVMKTPWSSK